MQRFRDAQCCEIAGCGSKHESSQRTNSFAVVETTHVMRWPAQTKCRVIPSKQRFDAGALARADTDHWLILQAKLSALQSSSSCASESCIRGKSPSVERPTSK